MDKVFSLGMMPVPFLAVPKIGAVIFVMDFVPILVVGRVLVVVVIAVMMLLLVMVWGGNSHGDARQDAAGGKEKSLEFMCKG